MKLLSFSLIAGEVSGPLAKAMDAVPSSAAHGVGVVSGLTGVALWADFAKHLTTFIGLFVAMLALAGAAFYALYWALKCLQKWHEIYPSKKAKAAKASSSEED
jgi:hypothetical protein